MFARLGTFRTRVVNVTKNSLAAVGFVTTLYAIREYNEYNGTALFPISNNGENNNNEGDDVDKKKKVLVIPFHQMKIVEQKKTSGLGTLLQSISPGGDDDKVVEVELRSLINTIHEAAADPEIVALYGTFGNGFRFDCGGYAHVEEVRDAIRVFNESHRRHYERNDRRGILQMKIQHDKGKGKGGQKQKQKNLEEDEEEEQQDQEPVQKYSFAYADTFDHPVDSANKEYFLASAFSNIQMQPRGNLNLFGVSTSNTFFYGALEKYGLKAHVFKHGKYKNAPNALTETGYTKSHLENTKSIVESINSTIFSSITHSRNLYSTFTPKVWQAVHDYGTLTATNAREVNLIDYTPRIDPLTELVSLNKIDDTNHTTKDFKSNGNGSKDDITNLESEEDLKRIEYLKKRWTWLKDQSFTANEIISMDKYMKVLSKREKGLKTKYKLNKMLNQVAEKNGVSKVLLSSIGMNAPHFNIDEQEYDEHYNKEPREKIAIVHINGGINDAVARKVVKSLREIKKDKATKAVIFRVDSPGGAVTASETILEECKDMQKPVICSFSNVAASGGYYVSSFADRIFASPTTLTGSIGVFGIKFDATAFARSYGVEVDFVKSGKHASAFSPFHPLTKQMKQNFERNMNKVYSYFKEIVSEGRKLDLGEVEQIARGRVWTGEQAKEIGLVDQIGGMNSAVLYAKRKYCSGGFADVEVWPKPLSLKDRLLKLSEADAFVSDAPIVDNSNTYIQSILNGGINPSVFVGLQSANGVFLTIDETTALHFLLKEALEKTQ